MTKTFYCITNGQRGSIDHPNAKLLRAACEARGITFKELPAPQVAYAFAEVPRLSGEGALYCLNVDRRTFQFAHALQVRNPQLNTWHMTYRTGDIRAAWSITLTAEVIDAGIIPTLYGLSSEYSDELVEKIEKYLGGFPVVLKKSGGSHGTGVMLIDSAVSLRTLLPHVIHNGEGVKYILRKFIPEAAHYRLVVLDGKVISTIKYQPQAGDIRTNAVAVPTVEPAHAKKAWQDQAIRAVTNQGVVFGGVDLLVTKDGTAYLAEVNTPCNFSRNQHCTGDDIAGQVVDYLCNNK